MRWRFQQKPLHRQDQPPTVRAEPAWHVTLNDLRHCRPGIGKQTFRREERAVQFQYTPDFHFADLTQHAVSFPNIRH